MPLPLISIITPTKNSADSIEKTIKSVLIQNSELFEHIIIDSNSTDNTIKIIQQFVEKYPLKYISEEDKGISEAFNKGISLSSGKWIIFLGAGDELYNSVVLSEMVSELQLRHDKLIVWGNIIYKNWAGDIGKLEKGDFPKERLKRYMCLPHQATFHNKRLFEIYGNYNTNYKSAMDYDLCLRLYDSCDFDGYINKTISYMLVGGISQSGSTSIMEFMRVQKANKIWKSDIIPNVLMIWASVKILIKKIIVHDANGV